MLIIHVLNERILKNINHLTHTVQLGATRYVCEMKQNLANLSVENDFW